MRRILRGHSGRALVHAVDDAGLEYKIEVPLEAVQGVDLEQDHVLVLTWSLQASPSAATPPANPAPTPRRATPSDVDRAFMELMAGTRASTAVTAEVDPTSQASGPQGLAELLGIKRA
ncbi:hypothetical protein [Nannocystis exedens]|uniref:hypothetical protein n=1 Tax=Nannocystis exedens TaxID=54 RepID=UPI0011608350|nr:hypothetical protein [Nannocystis exedens]